MVDAPSNFERVEAAANIYVRLSHGGSTFEIPVSDIDFTKDVDVERVREMGLYPDGYAINAIDIDGSLTFAGNVVRKPNGGTADLDDLLFDDEGAPEVFDITVAHEVPGNAVEDGGEPGENVETDTLTNCIVTSSEFSASSEETTESSYDLMAQRLD